MSDKHPIRILMSKLGLDGHDHAVKVITLALRDRGFEVIYTGLRQTPESIVEQAIQEDVDVIGISSYTGNHKYMCSKVIELLAEKKFSDILIIIGGIIPQVDVPYLGRIGVKGVFGPGSSIADIVKYIKENVHASQISEIEEAPVNNTS